jgi:hypothetical protein
VGTRGNPKLLQLQSEKAKEMGRVLWWKRMAPSHQKLREVRARDLDW